MAYAKQKAWDAADTIAYGLGWFSIGLGLMEIAAPRMLSRKLDMRGNESLLRAYGAREIATGIGLLTAKKRAPWLWGRVAGDVVDIATLAYGLVRSGGRNDNLRIALVAVAGITALDLLCAQTLTAIKPRPAPRMLRLLSRYRDRSGFPRPVEAMRGIARDFQAPRDMRIPELMRPYATSAG